ncbi:Hpt domain-containing protein [Sphingorhabdus arenilitoris]|uniref:Hpt domain-containing protein n=1 Tax=Sphingorhabdus arenilitoris TaxID=1490041 RepID=A0ABV8RFJ5_9SPHN
MSMDYGAFDTALKAAAGEDAALAAELRASFVESAKRQISLLSRSRCDANWQYSSWRLKGLAASFGATHLMELADQAGTGAPGDPVVIRELDKALSEIELHIIP